MTETRQPVPADVPADVPAAAAAAAATGAVAPDAPAPAAPKPAAGLGVVAMRGGGINSAVGLVGAALSYVQKLVLAWFLTQQDFALAALASTFVSFVAVFRDCGAGRILVQRGREFDRLAPSVFWLTSIFSVGCGLVVVALAPVAVRVYGRPELLPILLLMAAQFPISGAGSVSMSKLTIDMRWGAIGMTSMATILLTTGLSIGMAYLGYGVYAFVVPPLAAESVRAASVWYLARAGVRPTFDPPVIREVLRGSLYVVGSGLMLTARTQGDYMTLGVMERDAPGATGTGSYSFAYTTAAAPRLVLVNFIGVLFPIFARIEGDRARAHAIYCRTLHAVAAIGVLASVLAASLAWPLFRLVLPATWGASATLFAILIPCHLLLLLNAVVVQPMHAGGHFRGIFIFDFLFAPFELLCFAVGAYLGGTTGVAVGATVGAAVGFATWHAYSFRVLHISWRQSVGPLWKPLAAATPAAALAYALQRAVPETRVGDLVTVASVCVAGPAAYAAVLYVVWRPLVADAVGLLRRTVGRPPRAGGGGATTGATPV